MDTRTVPAHHDAIAPDGSEIRLLAATERASMVHCTLPPWGVSLAVTHRTVDELWFCLEGRGRVWRQRGDEAAEVDFRPGVSLSIPVGTHFQFRNDGEAPLRFVITTVPPWPGEAEARRVPDHWPPP